MNKKGGIGIVILIIVILIIGVGGYFTYNYFAKPRIIEEQIEATNLQYCNDPDGDDIYTRAKSSYSRQSPEVGEGFTEGSMGDICDYFHEKTDSRIGLVREGVCEEGVFKMIWRTCGWGYVCRNAACVKGDKSMAVCYDSDGGKNTNQQGNVIATGGSGDDNCWISIDGTTESGTSTGECVQEHIDSGRCYVNEYFCENDNRESEKISCPKGCKDGACL